MDVDTRYLHTFLAVCEEGGFGSAAGKLHRTQPAISYQVKMLEQQLGVQVFERMGRRLVLTPDGRRLRDFCRRYLTEFRSLRTQMARNLPAPREPLRIAAVSVLGRYVLFPILCRPRFARLNISLTFRTAVEVFQRVELGECDLGAVYQTKVSNYLQFQPLFMEELVLVASPAFRISGRELSRLSTYESLEFITYEEGDYVFGKWFQAFFGTQPAVTSSAHHFAELEEAVEMVKLNRGLSIVPRDAAAVAVRQKKLRILRPGRKKCLNQLFTVTRAGSFVRPEVKEIIDALRAV